MPVLDFILNCACLLLWLNWRSRGLAGTPHVSGIALVGTLRRAGDSKRDRWSSPAVLVAVLIVRAFLYWQVGTAHHWAPQISLSAVVLHFRPDHFTRMLAFSLFGFLRMLGGFYFTLLLLTALNRAGTAGSWPALIRAHLGLLGRLPGWLCLLLPFVVTFLFWLVAGPLLALIRVHLPVTSFYQLCLQASIIGLHGWMVWPCVIAALLGLHLVSSYVYFGRAPFWNFVNAIARQLLRPGAVLPLRLGKFDLVPLIGIVLMVLVALQAPQGLAWLYQRLAL